MELINTKNLVYTLIWQHERDGERTIEVHVYNTLKAALQGKSEIIDDINESDDGYFNGFKDNCFDNWVTKNDECSFYIFDMHANENCDYISIVEKPIEKLVKNS